MKRRSFFKALAAFCVMPSLPRTWAKPLKLTTYWCQTKRHAFVYNDAYVKALQECRIPKSVDFLTDRQGVEEMTKLFADYYKQKQQRV